MASLKQSAKLQVFANFASVSAFLQRPIGLSTWSWQWPSSFSPNGSQGVTGLPYLFFPKKTKIRIHHQNHNNWEIVILRCGAFYLYAGLALLGWLTFLLLLPETQGRRVTTIISSSFRCSIYWNHQIPMGLLLPLRDKCQNQTVFFTTVQN